MRHVSRVRVAAPRLRGRNRGGTIPPTGRDTRTSHFSSIDVVRPLEQLRSTGLKHARSISSVAVFAIVFALAAIFFSRVVGATLVPSDPDMARGFIGAFWGAFFAFFFVLTSTFLIKWYEERVRSHALLVAAGHRVNNSASRMIDALNEVDNLIGALDGLTGGTGTAPMFSNRLLSLEVDPHAFVGLKCRDLVGELLQFTVDTRLLNDYIVLLNRSHDSIQQAAESDALTPEQYRASLESMLPDLKRIRGALSDRKLDAHRLLATMALLAGRKPLLFEVTRWFSTQEYPDGFDEQIVSEMVRLQTDVVARQRQRKKRDDKMKSAYERALEDANAPGA